MAAAPIYAAAFAAQLGGDFVWSLIRDHLVDDFRCGGPRAVLPRDRSGRRLLTPVAFIIAIAAADEPLTLLAIGPLVWLLQVFSQDRRERYGAALELHRAYRGTVMLLSDVVEFDDKYTAEHSRSVVDLVHAVADELGIDRQPPPGARVRRAAPRRGQDRHPQGDPAQARRADRAEFEVMKNHTIEGQFMLDRVGGLFARVGEIVRSCHERWDGSGYPDGLAGSAIPLGQGSSLSVTRSTR